MLLRRLLPVLLFLLASFPALSQPADTLMLVLQWKAQAQFAGYYAALEKGFYAEEGVAVTIRHPYSTQPISDLLREDPDRLVVLPLDEALEIVDAGMPLVNLLQTSMNSALAVYTFNGNSPLTLQKPKVATWRTGYGGILRSWAHREHLDIEWIPASYTVNLLVSGAVDASAVMTYNEYYQIRQMGRPEPREGLYRLRDQGYNIQQDGVYMTRKAFRKHREEAEGFARASRRGWEWVAAHPEEALEIVMAYVHRNRVPTNRTIQALMLRDILELQLDPDSGERAFRLRPDMVAKASDMMVEAGVLTRKVSMEELLP